MSSKVEGEAGLWNVDPHSFNADPDPVIFFNPDPDPDPAFKNCGVTF